jgi:hypothetical protein
MDSKKISKPSPSELATAILAHATSHPPSDITSLISKLTGSKQAISTFKSFLETLANDDSGDSNDYNHQPVEDRLLSLSDTSNIAIIVTPKRTKANQTDLLASKKITVDLIASNEAKPVNICSALASSKPSPKVKKSVRRSSAKIMISLTPLLDFDPFPCPLHVSSLKTPSFYA